jgi:succinyl-CoA synthetase beta subunit
MIMHKTEIGGVRLDVPPDAGAVGEAYRAVTAAARAQGADVESVLVSPMRCGGTELLVGVVRDPHWGLMLAVALGGVFVEVLQDSVLAPMLGSLRGAAVLEGARGSEPADLDALAGVIARLGDLAVALGESLESLEVNPLLVQGAAIEALDAVVTWTRKD